VARATGLEAIKLARRRQREATGKISQVLVDDPDRGRPGLRLAQVV
jgi:hypothetical protein